MSERKELWDQLIKRIEEHLEFSKSSTWNSDRSMLLKLFQQANELGIDPTPLLQAKISNIRTIIRPLREAVFQNDIEGVNSLFHDAKTLSNSELRLKLRTTKPLPIHVHIEKDDNGHDLYVLRLSKEQFHRIEKSTKLFFKFPLN